VRILPAQAIKATWEGPSANEKGLASLILQPSYTTVRLNYRAVDLTH